MWEYFSLPIMKRCILVIIGTRFRKNEILVVAEVSFDSHEVLDKKSLCLDHSKTIFHNPKGIVGQRRRFPNLICWSCFHNVVVLFGLICPWLGCSKVSLVAAFVRIFCWGKKEIIVVVFGSLCLFEEFVVCFIMCIMMGLWLVFVGRKIDKNLMVVVDSIGYALGFVSVWYVLVLGMSICGLVIMLD